MDNARRRKEILLLASMLAMSHTLPTKTQYASLIGVYGLLGKVDNEFNAMVPNSSDRNKELRSLQKVVNSIFPPGFEKWAPEVLLWFTVQVVYRLVASGWKPPTDPVSLEFVQALYSVSTSLVLDSPPSNQIMGFVMKAPEALRAMGMYK